MVIGDSVTYEIQPGLTAALQHTGLVVSANRTQMGFGLSQWPIFHWWEVWEPFLEEVRPEAVVVQTGIWDVQAVYGGERRRPRPEDPDWEAQFAFLVGVALDVLTADGAHVYWLEGAHIRREIRPQNHPDRIDGLNGLVRAATVDLDHVTTVPYRDFIGANGTDRERHTRDDGVHLSLGGMAEVADWLVDDVFVESAPSVRESG